VGARPKRLPAVGVREIQEGYTQGFVLWLDGLNQKVCNGMGTKLGRVTTNDPTVRVAVSIHASNVELLKAYQVFYQREHGDEIAMSQLMEEMLKRFMRADPAFRQFVKSQGGTR
jgi:hypothetical protein